jgi:CheY-like chemotaxis protein
MWISGAVLQNFSEALQDARADAPGSSSEGELAGLRVFIVEDSSPIALNLEALVRGEGAVAWGVAANIRSALGVLSNARPDVALLDVNLEGESVLSIAERLKSLDVPFAFTTAYSESPFDFADWPKHPVLRKPYADQDVISALKALATGGPS